MRAAMEAFSSSRKMMAQQRGLWQMFPTGGSIEQ
jgi:hypothetical protein